MHQLNVDRFEDIDKPESAAGMNLTNTQAGLVEAQTGQANSLEASIWGEEARAEDFHELKKEATETEIMGALIRLQLDQNVDARADRALEGEVISLKCLSVASFSFSRSAKERTPPA